MRSIYYRKYTPYRGRRAISADSEVLSSVGQSTQYLRPDSRAFWSEKDCETTERYASKQYSAE